MLARVLRVAEIFTSGQSTQRGRHTLQHIHTHTYTHRRRRGEKIAFWNIRHWQNKGEEIEMTSWPSKSGNTNFASAAVVVVVVLGGSNNRKTMAHVCTCDGAFASNIAHNSPSGGGGIQRRNRLGVKRERRAVDVGSWFSPFIGGPDDSDLSLLFQFCCWSLIVSGRSCGLLFTVARLIRQLSVWERNIQPSGGSVGV